MAQWLDRREVYLGVQGFTARDWMATVYLRLFAEAGYLVQGGALPRSILLLFRSIPAADSERVRLSHHYSP